MILFDFDCHLKGPCLQMQLYQKPALPYDLGGCPVQSRMQGLNIIFSPHKTKQAVLCSTHPGPVTLQANSWGGDCPKKSLMLNSEVAKEWGMMGIQSVSRSSTVFRDLEMCTSETVLWYSCFSIPGSQLLLPGQFSEQPEPSELTHMECFVP